jgi:hypothetical protein
VEIGEKEKEAGEEGGKKSASRSPSRENGVAAIKEEEEKQKKDVESVQAKRNYRSGCGGSEKKGRSKGL